MQDRLDWLNKYDEEHPTQPIQEEAKKTLEGIIKELNQLIEKSPINFYIRTLKKRIPLGCAFCISISIYYSLSSPSA